MIKTFSLIEKLSNRVYFGLVELYDLVTLFEFSCTLVLYELI